MTITFDGCATSTQQQADALTLAGMRAVTAARRLYELDVFDPPKGSKHPRAPFCLSVIDGIMERCGWRPAGGYLGNGPPQWCGMFAEDVWREAGLDPKWFCAFFASTLRLHRWAMYQPDPVHGHPNPPPPDDDRRLCVDLLPGKPIGFEPRAGDIVIVGDGTPKDGDHITIVTGYSPNRRAFMTISGNGGGFGPRGDSREGISMREYFIDSGKYRAMIAIRPALRDLKVSHAGV